MKEKRICKRYMQSIKEEAVELVTEQRYGVQQAADSLGMRSKCCIDGNNSWSSNHP